ncbi:ABC transporter permease [Phototrophicus methaneseepsis]|uniref:ABC transporter permease n=1 Tax=Phototrophicus methaneseepsis TaxID=2710758 RepID=A0A7S8IDC4_9CHLR|nr:ABC transporter permease [Phototrophicus methaneseepsis]QPC80653.1 ABC transporter permease [Phototrophicus methaneseepsis]
MSFQLYFFRRLVFIVPLLFGITIIAFLIANAVPADPVTANLPQNALGDETLVQAFREKWGLDQPPHVQYLTYISNLLRGDMGTSIKTGRPVIVDIGEFLPATIELATLAIVFGLVMGVGVGIISAVYRNTLIDYVSRIFALIGVSFPVFLLALIGLTVLYAQLGIVAGPGRLGFRTPDPDHITGFFTLDALLTGDFETFQEAFSHIVLPAFILGIYVAGTIARVTRSALLEVLGMDYMRTARAKGLGERRVLWHGVRNALIPVVTIIGLSYGNLLAGTVLVESIFAWPGIGRYMFRASTSQDFPAIMGVSMLIALIYIIVNFVVDMLYFFVDPRIRTEGR